MPRGVTYTGLEVALGSLWIQAEVQGCVAGWKQLPSAWKDCTASGVSLDAGPCLRTWCVQEKSLERETWISISGKPEPFPTKIPCKSETCQRSRSGKQLSSPMVDSSVDPHCAAAGESGLFMGAAAQSALKMQLT